MCLMTNRDKINNIANFLKWRDNNIIITSYDNYSNLFNLKFTYYICIWAINYLACS